MTSTTEPFDPNSMPFVKLSDRTKKREAIISLLDNKVQEATDALRADLNKELWGPRRPNRIVVSPEQFRDLEEAYKPTQRFSNTLMMNAGHNNLLFRGIPVVADPSPIRTAKEAEIMGSAHVYRWEQDTLSGVSDYNRGSTSDHFTITNQILKENYLPGIKDQIFGSPLLDLIEGKTKMSVTSELRSDMNREKEVKRVKKQLKKFEGSWLYKLKNGAHIGFTVQFSGDKKYNYAAIFAGDLWHTTGALSQNNRTTDELVDWMIENEVDFKQVKLYKAVK